MHNTAGASPEQVLNTQFFFCMNQSSLFTGQVLTATNSKLVEAITIHVPSTSSNSKFPK